MRQLLLLLLCGASVAAAVPLPVSACGTAAPWTLAALLLRVPATVQEPPAAVEPKQQPPDADDATANGEAPKGAAAGAARAWGGSRPWSQALARRLRRQEADSPPTSSGEQPPAPSGCPAGSQGGECGEAAEEEAAAPPAGADGGRQEEGEPAPLSCPAGAEEGRCREVEEEALTSTEVAGSDVPSPADQPPSEGSAEAASSPPSDDLPPPSTATEPAAAPPPQPAPPPPQPATTTEAPAASLPDTTPEPVTTTGAPDPPPPAATPELSNATEAQVEAEAAAPRLAEGAAAGSGGGPEEEEKKKVEAEAAPPRLAEGGAAGQGGGPKEEKKRKKASPARWEEVGGLEWSKRWAAGPWGGPPPPPPPRPAPSWEELEEARTEPWGRIWERKYIYSKEETRCWQMTRVHWEQVVFKSYWGKVCPNIPNGIEYLRVERGLDSGGKAVDYFKPVEGSTLCQMMLSNNQHLWSSDGESWAAPPYYDEADAEDHLGGSAELPEEWAAKAGGRRWLTFWGHVKLPGGCCSDRPENDSKHGWGKDFGLHVCGKPQADLANYIDILINKLATPWIPFDKPGKWGAGLPLPMVKRLEAHSHVKPMPVQMRWAVPAHKASNATAQCLDVRSQLSALFSLPWRGTVATSCCDEEGKSQRPLCEEGLVWKEASQLCGSVGLRLCTRKELEHSLDTQGPCLFDQRLHWTADECSGPVRCFGEPLLVGAKTVADEAFWQEKCKTFPPGTEFVRLIMDGVVDYFKPTYGHSLCDMLTSNDKHLYSAEGVNWHQPPYAAIPFTLGGSGPRWQDYVNMVSGGMTFADDRRSISVWGKQDVDLLENMTGGCCQGTRTGNDDTDVRWGFSFTMTACESDPGAVTGDPAKQESAEQEEATDGTELSCPEVVSLVGTSDSKRMPNFAITASTPTQDPKGKGGAKLMERARLDSSGWAPRDSTTFWMQWDFGRPVVVTAIRLNGRYDNHHWVRTFTLSYAEEADENFTAIHKVFPGNPAHDTPVQRSISPPILARRIRFSPVTWHLSPTFRVDFLGCESPRGGLILGKACKGEFCKSMATCPEGQWPRSCQTEPVDSGAGAYVYGERSCVAVSSDNNTVMRARLLCGERKTLAASEGEGFHQGKVLTVSCPMGKVPLLCNCIAQGDLEEMCGGEAEFMPRGRSCVREVPKGTAQRRRRPKTGSGGARVVALCPAEPAEAPPKPADAAPEPRIDSQGPADNPTAAAQNVLADDGDYPGRIWLGPTLQQTGWFVLDLGREAEVGAFAIRNTVHQQVRGVENYTIEASNDKSTWKLAAEGVLARSLDLAHVDSAVATMRYVRFSFRSAGPLGGGLGYFAALAPEELAKSRGVLKNGSKCLRPPGWCTDLTDLYSEEDCDGDGVPDPHCTNGKRFSGFVSSADGCKNTWPKGGCQGACSKPLAWCPVGKYSEQDCDGDGIKDPYCQLGDQVGFLGSASNCSDSWPKGKCKAGCLRPEGWCQGPSLVSSYEDCDNDGILDFLCTDTNKGQTGFISSKNRCKDSFPYGGCHGSCRRPNGWCTQSHQVFDDSKDWDGDGIPDPSCVETRMTEQLESAARIYRLVGVAHFDGLNRSGFLSSRNLCMGTGHVGGKCLLPPSWCTHAGSSYQEKDCDADGIPDAYCTDITGTKGVISSNADCTDTWPHGGCEDMVKLSRLFLSRMQCQRPGALCECNLPFCKLAKSTELLKRVDVDGDGLIDRHFEVKVQGTSVEACGTSASSRRCLETFPTCLKNKSVYMRLLVWFKELQCELWHPAEILFLLFSFVACLFAYGICECPSRSRKVL